MRGLILGKFLPPHRGHDYLFQFARGWVDDLTIVVASLAAEPIAGELRLAWVRELAPYARVLHHTRENPSYPHEHPHFWQLWKESLTSLLPELPELVFSSEDYGEELARQLGATHVPVDPERRHFPVSGTAVREDPLAHWDFLPPAVRAHYALRVAIVGPESTGKTTLARELAESYQTLWVPEYARAFLDWRNARRPQDAICLPEDIPFIAAGQVASEDALARQAQRLLFCDTDLATTALWSRHFFGDCPEEVDREAERRPYDLTLLCAVDLPWEADPQRDQPHRRQEFLALFRQAYASRQPTLIEGRGKARLQAARRAVGELLSSRQKVQADVP